MSAKAFTAVDCFGHRRSCVLVTETWKSRSQQQLVEKIGRDEKTAILRDDRDILAVWISAREQLIQPCEQTFWWSRKQAG